MKTVTLNRNCDFRRLYYKGKSYTNPALVVYLKPNGAGICRIGITVSKKIGNAVERNLSPKIKGNWDFIFVSRTRTKFLKSTDIEKILFEILQKAGAV